MAVPVVVFEECKSSDFFHFRENNFEFAFVLLATGHIHLTLVLVLDWEVVFHEVAIVNS